jgi:hypothetical protein
LQDAVKKLPPLSDEEIKRLVDEEVERRAKQAAEDAKLYTKTWSKTGKDAARKYWEDDHDKWMLEAKKIIKSNPKIKSARKLSKVIAEKLGYDPEKAKKAEETIRKHKPITNLLKKLNK